jgi:hypothetical protein
LGLVDVWSYAYGFVLDLGDSVGLSLFDLWSYSVASNLGLFDSVDVSLLDGWGWSVGFNLDLSDSAGLSLSDSWVLWVDEVLLVRSVGFDPSYPAVVDALDLVAGVGLLGFYGLDDSVRLRLFDGWGLQLSEVLLARFVGFDVDLSEFADVVDLVVSVVSGGVSYPAVVDVVDLVAGTSVSVG